MTSRSAPSSVANVLSELELEQPQVVTKRRLAELARRAGVTLPVSAVAERLQRHGWLLPLRTRETWEFAPGSRAGPIGSGDPFIEVRATLARRPEFAVAVAYESSAWIHRLTSRIPAKHVLSIPQSESVPHALRDFRATRVQANLEPEQLQSLPVWRVESLVVLIGARPAAFRDWPNIDQWLDTAVGRVDPTLLLTELEGRPRSAWMRAGYLIETGGDTSLADRIRDDAPPGSGPFYLGPRDAPGRYNRKWQVHDSVLRYRHVGATGHASRQQQMLVEQPGSPSSGS
ncbi:MAG: type IV toxin-antitoxin system AbiEi family antitoxin [Acidimicrobiia bacterium]